MDRDANPGKHDTETCPLGTVSDPTSRERGLSEDEQFAYRAKQGIPAPFFEIRARGAAGLVPWDGESMGELEVRGVWVSSAYHDAPEAADRWTDDGWPAVAEAAVIAVPDPKWQERPLAVVVLREAATATEEELRDFVAPHFATWWLPDRFEFVEEIPKTAVGKFRKTALREQFAAWPVETV